MQLERGDGAERRIETRAELERALEDLGRADGAFAVLTRDDGAFAQAAGSRSGFVFEVVEAGKGVQSQRTDLSREEVVALFASWLERDEGWRSAIAWGPGPDDPASGARGGWIALKQRHALFVLAVAVAVAGVAEWRRQATRDVVAHLYVLAALIALLAAKVSRDIARREAREAAGGATGTGAAPGEAPRRRMVRG